MTVHDRYAATAAQALVSPQIKASFGLEALGLMKAGVEFCRMQDDRRIDGRAQKELLGYCVKMGWKPLESSSEFFFSDYAHVEIVIVTDLHPNAVTLGVDPYVLMRPGGAWDRPGVLDRSAQRGPVQIAAG